MRLGLELTAWVAALCLPAQEAFSVTFGAGATLKMPYTQETATRSIVGVKVTYPVDDADVIDLLEARLTRFIWTCERAADDEAEALVTFVREGDLGTGVADKVKAVLGGEPLSSAAEQALKEGLEEIAALGGQWRQWAGRIGEVRLWNPVTMKPYEQGGSDRHEFDVLSYERGEGGNNRFLLKPPFQNQGIGIHAFDPQRKEVPPLLLDMPNYAPPGMTAEEAAENLSRLLDGLNNLLRQAVTQQLVHLAMHYLADKLLMSEIEERLFAKPAPRAISHALARAYLFGFQNKENASQEEMNQILGKLFVIDLPEDGEQAARMLDQLAAFDPFDELPAEIELPAGKVMGFALVQAFQDVEQDQMPLQRLAALGIAVPENGFDQAAIVAAFDRAWPTWRTRLEKAKTTMTEQLRAQLAAREAAPAAASKPEPAGDAEIRYPDGYETLVLEGLTFHFPAALTEAVQRIGPQWAADLRKARAILSERFGGPWKEMLEITNEDMDSLAAYGIQPSRDEALIWAMQNAVVANLDKWVLEVMRGNEVAIWFPDDLQAWIGDEGRLGGFSFDFQQRSMDFLMEWETQTSDFIRQERPLQAFREYLERQPPLVFPVLLPREDIEGKSVAEQASLMGEKDHLLRRICTQAEVLEPTEIAGSENSIWTPEQAFFLVVHEVAESALIRQVIASADRRWFCDGMANLIAVRECDRRFGEGEGIRVFESMWDPVQSRKLASKVNLLEWKAAETGKEPGIGRKDEDGGLAAAHYYFATQALLAATRDREPDFVRAWIEQIRQTSWNRTNAGTVLAAYEKLTGQPLAPLLQEVVTGAAPE